MAHCEKFGKSAMGKMFCHYARLNGERNGNQEIDHSKSCLNYNLAVHQEMAQLDFLNQRLGEIHVHNRKDVNVFCDWVVTAPKDLPDTDLDLFFKSTYGFLEGRYGKENVISAYVHMDETTPHLHFAFVPVVRDKKRDGFKLSAKEKISRIELKQFHPALSSHLEAVFGRDVGILNEATKDGNKSIAQLKAQTKGELSAEVKALEQKKKQLDGECSAVELELSCIQTELSQKEHDLTVVSGDLDVVSAELREKQGSLEHLAKAVQVLQGQNDSLKSDRLILERMKVDLQGDCAEISNFLEQSNDKLNGMEREVEQVTSQLDEVQENLVVLEKKKDKVEKQTKQAERKLKNANQQIEVAAVQLKEVLDSKARASEIKKGLFGDKNVQSYHASMLEKTQNIGNEAYDNVMKAMEEQQKVVVGWNNLKEKEAQIEPLHREAQEFRDEAKYMMDNQSRLILEKAKEMAMGIAEGMIRKIEEKFSWLKSVIRKYLEPMNRVEDFEAFCQQEEQRRTQEQDRRSGQSWGDR
ncbi:MAG: MobV family relaxase [Eubacteriales bacterium]